MLLYNGVELPELPVVEGYPYAYILYDAFDEPTAVLFNKKAIVINEYYNNKWHYGLGVFPEKCNVMYFRVDEESGEWELVATVDDSHQGYILPFWTNTDIYYGPPLDGYGNPYEGEPLYSEGILYLAATAPVDPNVSTVINSTITIDSLQSLDDSASAVISVDGLGSTENIYALKGVLSSGGEEVRSVMHYAFAGTSAFFHDTLANLTPETEYTLTYTLYENDTETDVTVSQTFTTLASATADDSVNETETLSLLSAIYSAIINQNDAHLSMYEFIGDMLGHIVIRLRYIEGYVDDLVPSAEETALKTATAETTSSYTEMLWGGESGDSVGRNSFSTSTEAFTSSKNMLDTGVSVSDFFGMFGTYGWGNWFSAETRDDLDTVPSVSTVTADGELSTYEKNLKEIQSFIGGG